MVSWSGFFEWREGELIMGIGTGWENGEISWYRLREDGSDSLVEMEESKERRRAG